MKTRSFSVTDTSVPKYFIQYLMKFKELAIQTRTLYKQLVSVMKITSLLISMIFFSNLIFMDGASATMEPDEEALQDPKFVAEYGCLPEHFLIKKFFAKEEWSQAMMEIEYLEHKGYGDQFLSVAKAKVFTKMGKYEEALKSFRQALDEGPKCGLTAFNRFLHSDLAGKGIIWHYLSQVYELMGKQNEAVIAQTKSEKLVLESLDMPPTDEMFLTRVYYEFSLFHKPLEPY